MSMKDWFKSDAERLGSPVPQLAPAVPAGNSRFVGGGNNSIARLNDLLPRGADVIRSTIDRKESARWARPAEIAPLTYKPNDVLVGKFAGRLIGVSDDKPMVTVASARSGKTATVLKPALYTYPGSMLVLDPKGELAHDTAAHRQNVLGQATYILDPFGCSGFSATPFNPLAELDVTSATLVDDVDAVAQALILDEAGADGSHWTNSAQALVRGLILHTLRQKPEDRTLSTMRELLMLTYPPLIEATKAFAQSGKVDAVEATQNALFMEMAKDATLFGGALAGAGTSFLRKNPRERSSIISTAETQTRFLDSEPLQASLRASTFKLGELAERPMTIYLCLPSGQMEKHARWLRLIVRIALLALERRGTYPRGKPPIIFLCEEFATLGHLSIMEQAAAYFPGFGVKLWVVLQDLGQLQRHYKASWQTFLGNAGTLQFFGNGDKLTLDYISDRLGSLSFVRGQFGAVGSGSDGGSRDFIDKERLLYPHETAEAFARGVGSQLLMVSGLPPMAIERLTFAEVDRIKAG
jgi:type IV secretion system protein VirD4